MKNSYWVHGSPIEVLDAGSLEVVQSWGSDEGIVEAARMSTQKGFLGWGPIACPSCLDNGSDPEECEDKKPGDEKLLRYLYENKHMTPFEMAGLTVRVKAPIFVFREWHRHRTQSYNEMSARYIPLPNENYLPTVERLMRNSKTNKQAGAVVGSAELTEDAAVAFRSALERCYSDAEDTYQLGLRLGVPKELARVHLPVGRYSMMQASANLRNWLAFLTLRQAPSAQWEIQQYANAVGTVVKTAFPRTWELFSEGMK